MNGWDGRVPVFDRAILHVDMDAFFASVEQRDHPELRGKPVLVGGKGSRGVVAAASYEAREFGCHSALPTAIALRRCPQAIVVRGSYATYREVSKQVFAILGRYTPVVQPLSIDEAFLDVTGSKRLHGSGREIAAAVRRDIRHETELTASVGVSGNKFLAKLASDLDKPDGLTVIEEEDIAGRVAGLPIERMWGVGKASVPRYHRVGVQTFGDLQQLTEAAVRTSLGDHGIHTWRLSRGEDVRPVHTDRVSKSIGCERTFGSNLQSPDDVRVFLRAEVEEVAMRLRTSERRCRTVTIKIRDGQFNTVTRSHSFHDATDRTDDILAAAYELFETWAKRQFKPIRLIGASCSNFTAREGRQIGLFDVDVDQKRGRLDDATDAIRKRYGSDAVRRGGGRLSRKQDGADDAAT